MVPSLRTRRGITRGGNGTVTSRSPSNHYPVMPTEDIAALPIGALAARNSLLFMWTCWPMLDDALAVMEEWSFKYLTCAFSWTKAHANQIEMFKDDLDVQVGMGGWTRSNTEPCLLGKRGSPQRLSAAVRQAIVEPRREHSRKPDCIYERIEQWWRDRTLNCSRARAERVGIHGGWRLISSNR